MRRTVSFIASTIVIWLCFGKGVEAQRIIIESLNGSVTQNEIQAFKSFMQTRNISNNNVGNDWVYGDSGKDTEALGLMYEVTGDVAILDRMIQFADGALTTRNSATTGRMIWTGRRELCWPNKDITAPDAGYCGTESGDVVAHIAYCAKLILQTPAIWNTPVGVGDPRGYGATYRARALKYITEMDRTIDTFLLRWFVAASDSNHFRYPDTPQYGALGERYERNRGDPVPWNQQTMLAGGFLRLADCHAILGDDPSRVTRYDAMSVRQSHGSWEICTPRREMVTVSMIGAIAWAGAQRIRGTAAMTFGDCGGHMMPIDSRFPGQP
jgi:hypothetical protein